MVSRSQKIFVAISVIFVLFLVFVIYDISRRTTFPGSRKAQYKSEQIPADSTRLDSIPAIQP